MDRANDHLIDAHQHLLAAAIILEHQLARDYCRDVPRGRVLNLLDLYARIQEVKRLEASCEHLLASETLAPAPSDQRPVPPGRWRQGGHMD